MGSLCSKHLNSQMVCRERFLKAAFRVKIRGCMAFFWLAGGMVPVWCFRNLNHQPSSSIQSGFYMLLTVSMESSSSTQLVVLVAEKQLKGMCQFVMYISGGGTKTPSQNYSHYFSCLTAFLSLRSFIFLISNCLNLLFATQRKPRRLKLFLHKQEIGDMEELLY